MCHIPSETNPSPDEEVKIYVPKDSMGDIGNYGKGSKDLTKGLPRNGAMNVKKSKPKSKSKSKSKASHQVKMYPIVPLKMKVLLECIPVEQYQLNIHSIKDALGYLFERYTDGDGPWEHLTLDQHQELKTICFA